MTTNTRRVVVHVWWDSAKRRMHTSQMYNNPYVRGSYLGTIQRDFEIPCPTKVNLQEASKKNALFRKVINSKTKYTLPQIIRFFNTTSEPAVVLTLSFETISHDFYYYPITDMWYKKVDSDFLRTNGKTTEQMAAEGWVYDVDKNPDHWTCV